MRVGDALEVMSEIEEKRILSEGDEDFSARICTAASMEDLDPEALTRLRSFYSSKNGENTSMERASDEQFLSDVSLMRGGGLTYAAVVLLAKKEFLDLHLADAEICFEYRNKASDLPSNERKDYRKPFVLLVDEIWEKIASRQQVHPIIEGFLRRDIPAFNQEVFREALFNAVCHRDYTVHGSIFIKQSPDYIEITNPGGFPAGVTKENIIKAPSTPRNRLLAETFQRVFRGVERSGQGADKIFRLSIEEGKGLPDYSESTAHHVILRLPAMLKDGNFIKYLEKISNEKQITLSLDDMLLLEKIREGVKEGRYYENGQTST
jgi:ATP-dependent DNA helicase RecG